MKLILTRQVAVVVKCAMSRYQAAIYNWVKSTGTLRLDPNNALAGKTRHPFVPLNNKVMELRKVRAGLGYNVFSKLLGLR